MGVNAISQQTDIIVTILPAIISAAGAVIAALIAALIAKLAFEDLKPVFHSYSDKSLHPKRFIKRARHNIVIITALGNHLMPGIRNELEKKLSNDIQVYYLFLTPNGFLEIQKYLHGDKAKSIDVYNKQKDILESLASTYGSRFQVRTFPFPMTASYIGVDLPLKPEESFLPPSAVIQVMQYQYMVNTEDSPITFLFPKKDEEHFYSTVASMREMWKAGEALPSSHIGF